jgi:magnesium transporter
LGWVRSRTSWVSEPARGTLPAVNPTATLLVPEVQELIASRHFGELRDALHGLLAADVADILSEIPAEEAAIAFRILPHDDAGRVFSYMPGEKQEELIKKLGEGGVVTLVESMETDDRVKLLDELPAEVAARIVASLSPEERARTQAILGYPVRSVGRLMTPEFVRVRPEWSVARALEHIRRHGRDAETVNVVYVVDEHNVLVDDLRLRQLIMAEPDTTIESLMNRQFISLRADQPQEEAVLLLQKYDRVALPVVDSRGHLLGAVTHDDLADVAQAEATETIQKLGGMEALDAPYMETGLKDLIFKRGKWLAVLFLGEMLTASAMTHFNDELQRAVVLGLFLPLIISSGGNSGSQATTLIIRALALREIGLGDWWRVCKREVACGLTLGIFLGCIGFVRIHLWRMIGWDEGAYTDYYHLVAVTIFFALIGVVLWGTIMGSMLPFLLRRFKLDPAAISAPLVATLVDVTGLIIYFNAALWILHATLLRPRDPLQPPLQSEAVATIVSAKRAGTSDNFDLVVQTPEEAAHGQTSLLRAKLDAFPDHKPPEAGQVFRMTFEVEQLVKATPAGTKP